MRVIQKIREMKSAVRALRRSGKTIGFVATMGYLHQGHLSLVRASRRKTDVTVVSIFVNPAQFGPKEDFQKYPRNIENDCALLEKEKVDYLFCPSAGEMYPEGYKTYVEVHELQDKLCGRSRPGHFRGVATVVLKLLQIVQPDVAFFGRKDAQQAILLQKMCRDLNLDVKIQVMPIVRDRDGLALSSRNSYLNPEQRKAALILRKSLEEAKAAIACGERRADVLIPQIRRRLEEEPLARVDYIEIVDLKGLEPVKAIVKEALVALAVFIGRTRLIDNMIVRLKKGE
jgi:pantoate--beta-alanine ligase